MNRLLFLYPSRLLSILAGLLLPTGVIAASADAGSRIASNDPSALVSAATVMEDFSPAFSSASDVPITGNGFNATGRNFGNLALNYAPFNGTVLTAIQNTGTDPINGAFADLADRATVSAVFNGRTYVFIASYHGGSGNDLTLSLSGPGVLDPSFHAGADGEVSAIGIQADGKILIGGGTFLNVGEVLSQRIARLWPDGSIDADFKASSDGEIESFVIQDNGRIIIAGAFSQVNGFARKGIARLNSDGSLDMDFDLRLEGPVNCMSLLRGGKILVGGGTASTAPLGMGRRGLARLNADGTLDSTFSCDVNGSVTATTELADGSIMIGGQFSTVAGTARTNLAKITARGLLDSSFIADIRSGFIYCLAQQTDGKILVGGFALYTSSRNSQYGLIRLSSTGYFDPVYSQPSVGLALSLLVQLNDKVIVCGGIYDPVKNINRQVARINAQGIQETNFAASCNGYAYSAAMTPDGSILIGGGFRRMGEFSIGGIAKVKNVPVDQKLEIVGGNTLSWTRTGAATEFSEVDFQVSPGDGSDWTTLGVGTKISTGWQLVTDSLPSSGYVRARGREYSSNQAFATIEMTALFGRDLSGIEQWRQQHFGAPTNERSGADLADADGDGVKNLLEYAFGLPPRTSGSGAIPEWSNATEKFEIEFVQPPDVSGIIYGAEWSGSLEANDWHEVSDLGGGVQHRFVVPREGQPRRFVRLKVTHP